MPRQNAVLTEQKADETGVRLDHLPNKSLTQLPQQTQISNASNIDGD
jgi:hypothetical protein